MTSNLRFVGLAGIYVVSCHLMFVLLGAASQLAVLQTGSSGLSGTINFGESLSSGFGALASLSTAMASAEQQLQQLQQKQMQLYKLQQQKQKLVQKLAETSKSVSAASSMAHYAPYGSELFPPTPKNTPFFMTPPVTPPNESYHVFVGGAPTSDGLPTSATVAEKPPVAPTKLSVGSGIGNKKDKMNPGSSASNAKPVLLWPHSHNLFQPPPPQALVIERMHSGLHVWLIETFCKTLYRNMIQWCRLTDLMACKMPMCNKIIFLCNFLMLANELCIML